MFNRVNIGGSGAEKARRINDSLVGLARTCHNIVSLTSLLQETETIYEFLDKAADRINRAYPVHNNDSSLGDQLLDSIVKGETDCRLSATAMGLVMISSGVFDNVVLIYKPGQGKHIGVLGSRGEELYKIDFIDDQKGYRVKESSRSQLAGSVVFELNGNGILQLDQKMGR